jgi:GNAT superfamily N-acetyltransferase
METSLGNGYSLLAVNYNAEFEAYVTSHLGSMYQGEYYVNLEAILTEKEKALRKELSGNLGQPYQLSFYVCYNSEKIGWCFGTQTDYETFYLHNAAILPEHRSKGLGKAIIQSTVNMLKEAGFQKICSKHAATNNAVLIPLLRQGFIITGLEINDLDGVMVQLTYFFNSTRRKVVDFRVGKSYLTPEISAAINVNNT